MGHQLWTSPITGYRRRGTRLAEMRKLFEGGITARAVLEPLKSCPAEADAVEMAQILRARDFDVAGVQAHREGPVIGFVATESLQRGLVRDHVQQMTAEHLISDATPLASLLSILKTKERTFVLMGPQVSGIITRADLNKPPVRVFLFGLISLLEMHLTFWVKDEYPNDGWTQSLAAGRLTQARKLRKDRQARNQPASLLECLQFCDKRDLVLRRKDLRDRLELGSSRKAQALLGRAEKLRDVLAHSQQDLTQGSSWVEIIEVVQWVEATVHRSDGLVEEKARQSAKRGPDALWGSA